MVITLNYLQLIINYQLFVLFILFLLVYSNESLYSLSFSSSYFTDYIISDVTNFPNDFLFSSSGSICVVNSLFAPLNLPVHKVLN